MEQVIDAVRLPSRDDDSIAPVTILDAAGQVVRVVSAADFRRAYGPVGSFATGRRSRRQRDA